VRRANDGHFHAGLQGDLAQALFGLHLGYAIGVEWRGRIVRGERLPRERRFAIDFDGAHEHKSAYTGTISCNPEKQIFTASLHILTHRCDGWRMLARGKRSLQAHYRGSLRSHAFGNLRLGESSIMARFEQGIQKHGLFALNSFHFGLDTGTFNQLFDELVMCLHA
jgi:hypothetical protein